MPCDSNGVKNYNAEPVAFFWRRCYQRSFSVLQPKPEQLGVAANEQIRQNDFHGSGGGLRRNMQRIREVAEAMTREMLADPIDGQSIFI